MLVSGRRAGRILRDVLSSDELARLLLHTGIAGGGTPSSTGVLYDEDQIHALRLRPMADLHELARVCPHGLLVARLRRQARLHVDRPWHDVAAQVRREVAEQRPMSALTSALIGVRIRTWGPLPFAATFLGYVVFAAALVGFDDGGLRFQPPSAWAHVVERRRLHTRSGGRPCYLWLP